MTKKHLLLLVALLLPGLSQAQDQGTIVVASILLTNPASSCAVTEAEDLVFGSVELPSTGTASVTYNESTGGRTGDGAGGSIGAFRVEGSNTQTITVEAGNPSELTNIGGGSLAYERTWAQDDDGADNYTTVSGSSYDITVGGVGISTHYFRLGGTVSEIDNNDTAGEYSAEIQVTVVCSDL